MLAAVSAPGIAAMDGPGAASDPAQAARGIQTNSGVVGSTEGIVRGSILTPPASHADSSAGSWRIRIDPISIFYTGYHGPCGTLAGG